MNRYRQRLDAIEPAVLATMPLAPELEALLQQLAHKAGIPPDELRQEAVRIAMITPGMTDDEMLARVAGELGCSVDGLKRDAERLLACP